MDAMRKLYHLIPFLSLFFLLGCKDSTQTDKPVTQKVHCPELDSLYERMRTVEDQLTAETLQWNAVKPNLDQLYTDIKTNLNTHQDKDCFFLDNYLRPERDRFYFIELLTEVTIQQSLEEGILYLIKFRGLFIQDKEITEFISEDLAHVAFHNPQVYLDYLHKHAEQEEMLLHSTRWVTTDIESLIDSFNTLEGSEKVVRFLEEKI